MKRYTKYEWCVSDKDYRCNNHVEGHNRYIKTIINRNPTAWNFLDGLIDLAFDASSSFVYDQQRNFPLRTDRSKYSKPIAEALKQL